MKSSKKAIAFLFIFILGFFPIGNAIATYPTVQEASVLSGTENSNGDTSTPEINVKDPVIDISNTNLMDYVDIKEFESNGYLMRLEDEEDLNTYVFRNSDGSNSMYYLAEDVKFIDDRGNVVEKDVSLARNDTGFDTLRNNVSLHIPMDLMDGVSIGEGRQNVVFTPL